MAAAVTGMYNTNRFVVVLVFQHFIIILFTALLLEYVQNCALFMLCLWQHS